MIFTRKLKIGSYGDDVLQIKKYLLALGYFAPNIKNVTSKSFRKDTALAVTVFQQKRGLIADGSIDASTWAAIVKEYNAKNATGGIKNKPLTVQDCPLISPAALEKINADVANISADRYEFVKLALAEAYDQGIGPRPYPLSLYERGGNLYNKDLTRNVMSMAELEKYLARSDYKQFTQGREAMMRQAVKEQQETSGADCSGGLVGIARKNGKIKPNEDATANGLCGSGYSRATTKASLAPGDFVGLSGHIGLYVGGGYVVEWVGGAYGCQLTDLIDRRAYCFTTYTYKGKTYHAGTIYRMSKWSKFRTPLWYAG